MPCEILSISVPKHGSAGSKSMENLKILINMDKWPIKCYIFPLPVNLAQLAVLISPPSITQCLIILFDLCHRTKRPCTIALIYISLFKAK